ncbi:MAG TPA: sulfotransferase [Trebonia sp.]
MEAGDGGRAACRNPVFVLCAGRSGSTLLRFLLDSHPVLACPPETRIPWLCTQLASAWSVIEDVPPDALPESVLAGLRQGFEPMIASYLARAGKERFCDKSLGGAVHSRLLRAMWPDALFISLYRHPMDVIGSGIEAAPWGLSGYGFEGYVAASPGNSVVALARYWADYTAAIVAAEEHHGPACLRLRYEDLVANPEAQATRVFGFLGVRPVPGITQEMFSRRRQRSGPGDHKIWNTSAVADGSVGRGWEVPARLIPPPLLADVNALAEKLGYLPVGPDWGTGPAPADVRLEA